MFRNLNAVQNQTLPHINLLRHNDETSADERMRTAGEENESSREWPRTRTGKPKAPPANAPSPVRHAYRVLAAQHASKMREKKRNDDAERRRNDRKYYRQLVDSGLLDEHPETAAKRRRRAAARETTKMNPLLVLAELSSNP